MLTEQLELIRKVMEITQNRRIKDWEKDLRLLSELNPDKLRVLKVVLRMNKVGAFESERQLRVLARPFLTEMRLSELVKLGGSLNQSELDLLLREEC